MSVSYCLQTLRHSRMISVTLLLSPGSGLVLPENIVWHLFFIEQYHSQACSILKEPAVGWNFRFRQFETNK